METPPLRWTPTETVKQAAHLTRLMTWLTAQGHPFQRYEDLWEWSTTHYQEFWTLMLKYFEVAYAGAFTSVVQTEQMPGIRWFSGIQLNYAEHIFKRANRAAPAIIACDEQGRVKSVEWVDLENHTASIRHLLKQSGLRAGDCVAAFMPNVPETSAAFLATASIGAVWSCCSPDFGAQAVLDRFQQIRPKVLFAVNSYRYGGKTFDKTSVIAEIASQLPTVQKVIVLNAGGVPLQPGWMDYLDVADNPAPSLSFDRVEFNDPLWVLYSSGTTGLPKAITHSQGGMLMEQLKYVHFHQDVQVGDRCFWFTTTGWMMWNYLHGCWLAGGTIVQYDGSPAFPDLGSLWKMAAAHQVAHFGTSAGFILSCMKGNIDLNNLNFNSLRSIGSTGSTLPPEGFAWVYEHLKKDIWLTSMSGGTDVCSAFVGGNPLWPVYEGEIQCRALGCKLEVWNEDGQSAGGEEGEMVITAPMPCMPIYLWDDPGFKRYKESYFEMFPGTWRHGDWIQLTPRNGIVIYGRSDATLNRGGVRIGTSEIYRAIDLVPEVKDSLIICLEKPGGQFHMPLFVVMQPGQSLTDDIRKKINATLRQQYSPRHVPDEIVEVPDVPYTLSGKKTEMPIKKILSGRDPASVANRGTLRNPGSLDFFIAFAARR